MVFFDAPVDVHHEDEAADEEGQMFRLVVWCVFSMPSQVSGQLAGQFTHELYG